MRIARFSADGFDGIGLVEDHAVVELQEGSGSFGLASVLAASSETEPKPAPLGSARRHRIQDVTFRPPIESGAKIFCIGANYPKVHPVTGETVGERPPHPTVFLKTLDALVGHGQPILFPRGQSDQLDYEGELTVVIGRGGRHIAEADAYAHVAGYTIMNEGSVRDWQKHSLFSGKNFEKSGSCGPWITTADEVLDPMDLALTTYLNGDEVQRTSTGAMLFSIPWLISHISAFLPLAPGDLIATGSPEGSGGSRNPQRFLRPGDAVEVEISGLGRLANVVE